MGEGRILYLLASISILGKSFEPFDQIILRSKEENLKLF